MACKIIDKVKEKYPDLGTKASLAIRMYVNTEMNSGARLLQSKLKVYEEKLPKERLKKAAEIAGMGGKPFFDKLPSYKVGQTTMTYAGIGSRETPPEILAEMTKVATKLESLGYKLQTGKTFGGKEEGADKAFSDGATNKELFGPEMASDKAKAIAKEIHPAPQHLKEGALKLMARNTNQVFGANLSTPVDFVLFYAEETSNKLRPKGGTGQAVEMARRKGIPTINMADPTWGEQLQNILKNTKTQSTVQEVSKQKTESIKHSSDYKAKLVTLNQAVLEVLGSNKPKIVDSKSVVGSKYNKETNTITLGIGSTPETRTHELLHVLQRDLKEVPSNVVDIADSFKKIIADKVKEYYKDNVDSVIDNTKAINIPRYQAELVYLHAIVTGDYRATNKDVKFAKEFATIFGSSKAFREELLSDATAAKMKDSIELMIANPRQAAFAPIHKALTAIDDKAMIATKEYIEALQLMDATFKITDTIGKTKVTTKGNVWFGEHMKNGVAFVNRVTKAMVAREKKNSKTEPALNEIENFGNPFATVSTPAIDGHDVDQFIPSFKDTNGKATSAYISWLISNEIPAEYTKSRDMLAKRREFILKNLNQIKDATSIYYAGTATGDINNSHAVALEVIANQDKVLNNADKILAGKGKIIKDESSVPATEASNKQGSGIISTGKVSLDELSSTNKLMKANNVVCN